MLVNKSIHDRIVIDSIDKNAGLARIEICGTFIEIPLSMIPYDAVEGSVLKLCVDESNTQELHDSIRKLENRLFV